MLTRSAFKLVGKIMNHGFGRAKGEVTGSEAVSRLMDMIMKPQPIDDKRRDGDVIFEQEIESFWRQMRVKSADLLVVGAIREILKKFYIGAKIQVNPESAKADLAEEFDGLYKKPLVGGERNVGAKGGKRAASTQGKGKGTRTKKPNRNAIKVTRWRSYEDVVTEMVLSNVAVVYVSAETKLTGAAICTALVARNTADPILLCSGYINSENPGTLALYAYDKQPEVMLADDDNIESYFAGRTPILVVENYGNAANFDECTSFWPELLSGEHWTYVGVGGVGDDEAAMVKTSSIVVGNVATNAKLAKKLVALPKCTDPLPASTQRHLRTYSDKLYLFNAPMLSRMWTAGKAGESVFNNKGLKRFVGCGNAELQVEVDGSQTTENHHQFVLRVNAMEDKHWQPHIDILVKLAFQANVHLVTTPEQAKAIEDRYTQRESERPATEDSDAPAATGENGKKRKSKKGSSEGADAAAATGENGKKRKSKKGSSEGADAVPRDAATRVTSYEDVLSTMVEEAEHDSIIYVDRAVWFGSIRAKKKKKNSAEEAAGPAADADTICRHLLGAFESLLVVNGNATTGTFGVYKKRKERTKYTEAQRQIMANDSRVSDLEIQKRDERRGGVAVTSLGDGEIDLGNPKLNLVVLVVAEYGNANAVDKCIKRCRDLLKWSDSGNQSWQTIVVGDGAESDRAIRASVRIGGEEVFESVKINDSKGSVGRGAANSNETQIRTFAENLLFANVPNLTPYRKNNNTRTRVIHGGFDAYLGSEYVSMKASRNGGTDFVEETAMVFVLRVVGFLKWESQIQTLVKLARQKNVMLIASQDQHDAIVKASLELPKGGVAPGGSQSKTKSPANAGVEDGQDEVVIPPTSETWLGPARILGETRMYLQVDQANCGSSWTEVQLSRANVDIAFLQVRQPDKNEKTKKGGKTHHAERKKREHALYIRCDSQRNVTGEYVSKTGAQVEELGSAEDVSKKLEELEKTLVSEGKRLTVYILCEQIDDPSGTT
jgi:hypothetical protein